MSDEYEKLTSDPLKEIQNNLVKIIKKHKQYFSSQQIIDRPSYSIKDTDELINGLLKEFFRQKDGISMGSVIGPKLAEICMKPIDDSISQIPGIDFYARYVDDILIIFDSCVVTPREIEDYANTLKPNIKFTSEIEQNQEINYLDVTIKREKTQLLFRKYEKLCNTEKTISYKSYCPIETKKNVFSMELRKILNRTTLQEDIDKEIKQLFRKYLMNDYPKNKIFAKQENKMSNIINIINTKGQKTVRNQLDVAGVVYKISCDCLQAKSYVGETGRKLEIRLKEHEAAIRLKRQESPWYQHCVTYNCKINRSSIKILYKMENLFKRRVVEHLCIIEYANLLNQNVGLNVDACWEKFLCIKGNRCLVV
ncbi:uncharacterized protein LOC111624334 [Centruroides sculpturatus]|uniref:uncharacterized protein LOC111624334 n=2 Tax=Centruroides sculpturatus TaxID=218467 RepID=UPI000C6D9D78|nr:uncharacterized protein LOC111624334 [Centruroides sculpturatus]